MPSDKLQEVFDFNDFSVLYLNRDGRFSEPGKDLRSLADAKPIEIGQLESYLKTRLTLPADTTDVFVWIHGWRNGQTEALSMVRKMFGQMVAHQRQLASIYKNLDGQFKPAFVIVRWPSWSSLFPTGYNRMKQRASRLTKDGYAEFFLASLLGYLDKAKAERPRTSGVLRARGGYFVHCIGHSFGGRFLTAAVKAAANPESPKTLAILKSTDQHLRKVLSIDTSASFQFTVDNLIVFQMAAPASGFADELDVLTDSTLTALSGPLILTHSKFDDANCVWHALGEFGEQGIGCVGAKKPSAKIENLKLANLNEAYESEKLSEGKIVNIDCSHLFQVKDPGGGAHGDIFYPESLHLILSLANLSRER